MRLNLTQPTASQDLGERPLAPAVGESINGRNIVFER